MVCHVPSCTAIYKVFAKWADDGSLWQACVASVRHLAAEKHLGVPGVFGRKFTVCPSAFDFTELTSVGDQKGCRKSAQFRLENRGFFLVCEVIIYESLCDPCNR